MAALQATSLAKSANRSAPGGVTSASYFGGLSAHQLSRPDSSSSSQEPNHFSFSGLPNSQAQGPSANVGSARTPLSPSRPAQTMFASQPQMNIAAMQQQQHQQNQFQRKRQFLTGLASIMQQRGTPLPPNLTGLPYPPNYDPSTSPWRTLEVSNSDLGVVRLAGKDIDLFRLWAVVQQAGSGQKVRQLQRRLCTSMLRNGRKAVSNSRLGTVVVSFRPPRTIYPVKWATATNCSCLTAILRSTVGSFRRNIPQEHDARASCHGCAQSGSPNARRSGKSCRAKWDARDISTGGHSTGY